MLKEKIEILDGILRDKHQEVYSSLRPGVAANSSLPSQAQDWYGWKDGQNLEETTLFLGTYRFIPLEEGRHQASSARSSILTNPVQAAAHAVFARKDFYSWPILIDGAGEGYFFNTASKKVFYKFEGERDQLFRSFEVFVDFLIELAGMSELGEEARIDRELELLDQHTS